MSVYKHDLVYQCHRTLSYQLGAAVHRILVLFSLPSRHYARFFLCPTPVPLVSWSGPTDNVPNQALFCPLTIHMMNPSGFEEFAQHLKPTDIGRKRSRAIPSHYHPPIYPNPLLPLLKTAFSPSSLMSPLSPYPRINPNPRFLRFR